MSEEAVVHLHENGGCYHCGAAFSAARQEPCRVRFRVDHRTTACWACCRRCAGKLGSNVQRTGRLVARARTQPRLPLT